MNREWFGPEASKECAPLSTETELHNVGDRAKKISGKEMRWN